MRVGEDVGLGVTAVPAFGVRVRVGVAVPPLGVRVGVRVVVGIFVLVGVVVWVGLRVAVEVLVGVWVMVGVTVGVEVGGFNTSRRFCARAAQPGCRTLPGRASSAS